MKNLLFGFFTLVICLLTTLKAQSQFYYYNSKYYDKEIIFEVGGSAGTMHAYTDVGRKKFSFFIPDNFDLKSTRTNVTFYAGVTIKDVIGLRLEYIQGNIAADDANGTYKFRNTNFRSSISEIALVGEFHPLAVSYLKPPPRLSPYVAAGIGYFTFNPQTNYKGNWIDLKPLRTEGQGFAEYPDRKEYKLASISLPLGAGLKYELSPFFTVRGEVLFRYTLTDYLDDAKSTSVDPSLYFKYFSEQKAALASALTNRTKEKNPASPHNLVYKGSNNNNDAFVTVNIKFGIALGRERVH